MSGPYSYSCSQLVSMSGTLDDVVMVMITKVILTVEVAVTAEYS